MTHFLNSICDHSGLSESTSFFLVNLNDEFTFRNHVRKVLSKMSKFAGILLKVPGLSTSADTFIKLLTLHLSITELKCDSFGRTDDYMLHSFEPAGIFASGRFRGVNVGKVCVSRNTMDRFSSLFALEFSLASQSTTQNVNVKVELKEKYDE